MTAPARRRSPAEEALWVRRHEPHVAPLTAFADELAVEHGWPAGQGAVPYANPDGAGVHARVLFLLNDPGEGAKEGTGSGLLAMVNADQTSRKQRKAVAGSGFDLGVALHWNGIPWPVAERARDREAKPAAGALARLLDILMPYGELRGVITLGRYALKVWDFTNASTDRFRALQHVDSTHPATSSNANLLAAYVLAADIAAGPTPRLDRRKPQATAG